MTDNPYDSFSHDYDRFVNWESRLNAEIPFLENQLIKLGSQEKANLSILDAACGTGMHAIELARRGYHTFGADLSGKMIEKARINAKEAGVEVGFRPAGFMQLEENFRCESSFPFDAIICLGNSLPHITSQNEIHSTLADFSNCLRPGGLLILQNRNFDAVMAKKERWIGPQSKQEQDNEWLFLRFYDFDDDGLITFNIVRLTRRGDTPWKQEISAVRLYPLTEKKLTQLLKNSGFQIMQHYGIMDDVAFNPENSENLVAVSRKI